MNKFTHLLQFVQYLFEEKEMVQKAKPIRRDKVSAAAITRSDIF